MEILPAFGWPRNLRLSNGEAEVVVTLDVGPRILSYRLDGRANVLKQFDDQLGGVGEADWMIRGGHRLWVAPEDPAATYVPDNAAVAVAELADGWIRLTPPVEASTRFQKELDLRLAASGARLELVHRVQNVGWAPRLVSVWALTALAPGGVEIIPRPGYRPHPGHPRNARSAADFAPEHGLVAWPFLDFADPRWRFGARYLTLTHDPARGPTKLGVARQRLPVGYLNAGTLFVKRFDFAPAPEASFPDLGCNFETFANEDMVEIETLGPLRLLQVGEVVEHAETWELHGDVAAFDSRDDAAIDAAVGAWLRTS